MGTIFNRDHEPPKSGPEDAAYAVVETLVSVIPGGAALLKHVIVPPMERRLLEWMDDVGTTLRELSDRRGIDLEALKHDSQFVDAFAAASQAALRTSQTEKRKALRNAILNAALPGRPDETLQHIFIGMIDRFTGPHLRMLEAFNDPAGWVARQGGVRGKINAQQLAGVVIGEAGSATVLADLVWADLYAAGLVKTAQINNGPEGVIPPKRTSDIASEFLAFIRSPV